ncbi:MAG: cell division protein ZapD [Woeseiaceae bacterium]|nr:cell division protein ZapD [Woeseiaceae bacterium]
MEQEADWATRAATGSLLEIMAILGRGDVRSDVHKELDRQLEGLEGLPQPARRGPASAWPRR